MPSDAIWVAIIAAMGPLAVEVVRNHLQKRDAEKVARNEERAREAEQEAARQTVGALKMEVRGLKFENRELRAENREMRGILERLLRVESDGRLGTRSPRDTA